MPSHRYITRPGQFAPQQLSPALTAGPALAFVVPHAVRALAALELHRAHHHASHITGFTWISCSKLP